MHTATITQSINLFHVTIYAVVLVFAWT